MRGYREGALGTGSRCTHTCHLAVASPLESFTGLYSLPALSGDRLQLVHVGPQGGC